MNQLDSPRVFFDSESKKLNSILLQDFSENEKSSKKSPRYNVVLLDDNDHTYDYVIEMLMHIFGYDKKRAFEMTCEVDFRGRVVVYCDSKEIAEEKSKEIMFYGADWRLKRSKGSMSSVIEPVE